MQLIGLMDYDVLLTKYYKCPNYDLGVMYAYYKSNPNISIRLITTFSTKNLSQYDKIYVFKRQPELGHPSGAIRDYYKLPIEEYGPGFRDKPVRPMQRETQFLLPDFTCYNKIILFSLEHPKHPLAWHLHKQAKGGKYKPLRLYETIDGEELKKDYPTSKYHMIYDDPVELLNNPAKWEYYNQLLDKKHHFAFAQSLDISRLNDTNILEQVLNSSKYASIRQSLVATELNDVISWLVNKIISKECKKSLFVLVSLPKDVPSASRFEMMMLMNYYNFKTYYRLRLIPTRDFDFLTQESELALLAFDYLTGKPYYMSFYEYVFNISYLRQGVPKELIHTGEDRYELIFEHYGMSPLLIKLEDWLKTCPQNIEGVFIGGDSNYEKQRRKYYDSQRGKYAFGGSATNASQERSTQ